MPPGDVLIHAGDFTRYGRRSDADDFNEWLGTLPYAHNLVVLGNHEVHADWAEQVADVLFNATVLKHQTFAMDGLTLFGCDFFWPVEQNAWEPPYGAIPEGVDVVVAHGPCAGLADGGMGCATLIEHMARVRPRLFVCGHIHHAAGVVEGTGRLEGTTFANVASELSTERVKAKGRPAGSGVRVRPPVVWELRRRASRTAVEAELDRDSSAVVIS